MENSSYKEPMYTYYMTTGLPISMYDKDMDLIHSIGIPKSSLYDPSNVLHEIKSELSSKKYANHQSHLGDHYLCKSLSNKGNLYYLLVGPFTYSGKPFPKATTILKKHHQGKINPKIINEYFHNLAIAKIGSINQHYKYLELLFDDEDLLFNDIHKQLLPLEKIEKNMMEYREIDFFHHNYFLEDLSVNYMFKGRRFKSEREVNPDLDYGTITQDYERNRKNLAIIGVGIYERHVIEQGMDSHLSFTIGDAYLRMIESAKTVSDVDIIMQDCWRTYYHELDRLKDQRYSKTIANALRIIDKRLNEKFTLSDLSEELGVSTSSLSKLFRKELNISFTDYLLGERIEQSKKYLKHSNYSLAEISDVLAFSSKSYFVKCFKKVTGTTPHVYAERFSKLGQ